MRWERGRIWEGAEKGKEGEGISHACCPSDSWHSRPTGLIRTCSNTKRRGKKGEEKTQDKMSACCTGSGSPNSLELYGSGREDKSCVSRAARERTIGPSGVSCSSHTQVTRYRSHGEKSIKRTPTQPEDKNEQRKTPPLTRPAGTRPFGGKQRTSQSSTRQAKRRKNGP